MTPDEIHRQGLAELEELHGWNGTDPARDRYTKGSRGRNGCRPVPGPRANKFAEGEPGPDGNLLPSSKSVSPGSRRRCRAPLTSLVDPPLEVRRLPLAEEPGAAGGLWRAG